MKQKMDRKIFDSIKKPLRKLRAYARLLCTGIIQARAIRRLPNGSPRLRWTIDTAAPSGPERELWGDTHFANSLAAALQRLGQEVVVDPREGRNRVSRSLDDVVLVLRGLDRVHPTPDTLNILWIISHPDEITREEVAEFDIVYAASESWAKQRSAEWGIAISPLLQCTDSKLFNPRRGKQGANSRVVFVGNSRGVERPVVAWAIAEGIPIEVYGSNWEPFIPAMFIAGTYVPNQRLGKLYAHADAVLNDHWLDMRDNGFISNRIFDALACGACVVSDYMPEIALLFGDSVRMFSSPSELSELLQQPVQARFPDWKTRVEIAQAVVSEHSFDTRAAVLLEAAAESCEKLKNRMS